MSRILGSLLVAAVIATAPARAGAPPAGGEIPPAAAAALQEATGWNPLSTKKPFEETRFIRGIRALVSYNEDWRKVVESSKEATECFWLRLAVLALQARDAYETSRISRTNSTVMYPRRMDVQTQLQNVTQLHRERCGPGGPGNAGSKLWSGEGAALVKGRVLHDSRWQRVADTLRPWALGAALAGIDAAEVISGTRPPFCERCQPAEPMPALLGAAVLLLAVDPVPGDEVAGAALLERLATQR